MRNLATLGGNMANGSPAAELATVLLWLSGPLTLALGALAIYFAARRPRTPTPALSAAEEERLAALSRDAEES